MRADSSREPCALLVRLDLINQRHPWSHNDRFVGWVDRQVAEVRAREVLDVGCGTGNLIHRLRRRVHVVGLEPDHTTAITAARRFADDPSVSIEPVGFADRDHQRRWDAITMVAVLHHLPLATTLTELRAALRSGGRLVVVGCYVEAGIVDTVLSLASVLANPLIGMIKHPGRARELPEHMRAPTAPPRECMREIARVARRELPDVRVRRRMFWRYTLVYDAP